MKIHDVQQGSVDWMLLRSGIPTASELDNLVTPEFKIRPWSTEMPNTYLSQKVAEAWLGGPLPGFSTFDVEQGQILEGEARGAIELELGETIERVGFITTDDGRVGCSPDGLLGDDCGVEIKCPHAETHVKYLLAGGLPKQYQAQVHASMFVTGRSSWKFVSYRRRFPKLVVTVERDEKIQAVIAEAVAGFLEKFDAAMAKIESANGGPNLRRIPKAETEQPEPMLEDVVP